VTSTASPPLQEGVAPSPRTPVRPHRGLRARAGSERVVESALLAYDGEHGSRPCAPVTVVIAALDEAANLPAVLAEIPRRIAGSRVDVLVVDDGSGDGTEAAARAAGALVLRLAVNCGHGTALRAGYRLAGERGAEVVATLDGDGQWDPADLDAMVRLVLDGDADMAIGSRVLGATEDAGSVRNAGVQVFGRLARVLTGTGVTDTSSGLRAIRTPVLTTVRQLQPQYQTSELLVGAALAGWRLAEVPTTMRRRLSGESKKGHNALYGLRFARVLLGTWVRESLRAPLPGSPRDMVPGLRPPAASRLLRFGLVSALCLGVSELVLLALVSGGWHGWSASLAASGAGVVPGYPLHRGWSFSRRGRGDPRAELLPYLVTSLTSALVAAVGTGAADGLLRSRVGTGTRGTLDAAAFLTCYAAAWLGRFTVLDCWLFRPHADDDDDDPGPAAPDARPLTRSAP